MKYIVCLNQKSVIFILLLNSKTHSPGDTLNLEKQPSEQSWLRKLGGVQGNRNAQQDAGTVHLKPAPGNWPSLGCQAAMFKLLCCGIAGNPNHK